MFDKPEFEDSRLSANDPISDANINHHERPVMIEAANWIDLRCSSTPFTI